MKCCRTVLLFFIIFFLMMIPVFSNASSEKYSGSFSAEQIFLVTWEGDQEQIHFTIQAKTPGWVAIGFNPTIQMKNADMIMAYYDSVLKQGFIRDCYSIGENGPHPEDVTLGGETNIESFSISENNGATVVDFTRTLNTQDTYDVVIDPNKELKLIWAIGQEDNAETLHSKMGLATIHLNKINTETSPVSKHSGKPSHFYLMGFGLLLISIAVWSVKQKFTYPMKMKLHTLFVSIGSLAMLIGFGLQFLWLQRIGLPHFRVLHAWFGVASLVFLLISMIEVALYFIQKSRQKRNWHISLGVASVVLALIAAILGKFLVINLF